MPFFWFENMGFWRNYGIWRYWAYIFINLNWPIFPCNKVKCMFIGVIYKKIHSLSLNSIDRFEKGKIINIAA